MVEQTQAILQAQYAGYGIIDAAHRYLAFLNQFLQVVAEAHFVRHHRHVDTGIDGNLDGLLLGCCNVVARTQVIDVRPVGHDHAVPVQVFLQPFGQQFTVGMERHAVVYARVYHHRQGSGSYSSQERSKVLFAQIRTGNRRRCTVLTRYGNAITHIVLHAGSHVVFTDMVRVASLKTSDGSLTHFRIYIAVFTVVLPHTRPARVTSQVDYRCIRPGNAASFGFVS
ncbi:unknown [Bacteroides sp. CAG:443]|nr:unknown [Bacteroides sp. CAG:443]